MTQSSDKASQETRKALRLPLISGTVGPAVVDVRKLYAQEGVFTFDPGFTSTASCESQITYIDGDKGQLWHRGYPIEELAAQSTYLEVASLLMAGELPSQKELSTFQDTINGHTILHEQIRHFFSGFRRDAHPVAVMVDVVGALSAFYHDSLNVHDPEQRRLSAMRLLAKVPTIAAMAYRYYNGFPFMFPQNNLSYAGNLLYMMFGMPSTPYNVDPVVERAIDQILILHADHEQNASTSTVRMVGSSGANPFACIAAGIASLWGPSHGGANEAVILMLQEIGSKERIKEYIARAKDKNDPFRLMGFGHRVYKNYDPRAAVLRESCHKVLEKLGVSDPLLELALELERIALEDDYFIEKKLFPNVDFYSGIILKALGIPTPMYTALFAVSRNAGWLSQWMEMMSDPAAKIGRPRQLYTGEGQRSYLPIGKRP